MRRFLATVLVLALAGFLIVQGQGRPRLRGLAPVPGGGGGGGGLTAHPRIWLDAATLAAITAKKNTSDADWVAFKAGVDAQLALTLAKCTITGATNANPVVFTCTENVSFAGTANVMIAGGTGGWAGVNTAIGNNVTATKTGTKTFSVPINSSAFGTFSGQTLSLFQLDGESGGFLGWQQYGDGYIDALGEMALAYKITGTASYLTYALADLDYVNTFGATGNVGPQQVDGGRAGTFKTIALAIAYDWLYADLNTTRRNATIVTLNLWATFSDVQGTAGCACAYAYNDPTSNYWEGFQSFIAATAYATYDENASGPTWKTLADTRWTGYAVGRLFAAPSTVTDSYDIPGLGAYYGGTSFLGDNYGGNDIGRHLKYMTMVKTATGTLPTGAIGYAQNWARAMIHEVKPDRYRSVPWGRWTGSYYGVMSLGRPMLLGAFLAGTTEGAWSQWLYAHVSGTGVQDASGFDKLLFYNSAATQTDYTATEVPYAFFDGTSATLYWRGSWGTSSDYALIQLSPGLIAADLPKDAGHIELTRGADQLLVQASMWKDSSGLTGSPETSAFAPSFTNTLYFYDGGGGTCFSNGVSSAYDGCQQLYGIYRAPTTKLTSTYAYALQDYVTTYGGNGTMPANRTLKYFIRSFVAAGDGTYVVWDRVRSTKSEDTKQIRWHLNAGSTPTVVSGLLTSTVGSSVVYVQPVAAVTGGSVPSVELVRDTTENGEPCTVSSATAANPVVVTCTTSTSWIGSNIGDTTPVLLTGANGTWSGINNLETATITATRAGGSTFSVPVNGTGFGSYSGQTLRVRAFPISYRVQVTDPIPQQVFNSLAVLYTAASGVAEPTITALSIVDSNFTGIQVQDSTPKVVVLPYAVTDNGDSTYTSTSMTGCTFTSTHTGTGHYIVAGLTTGNYLITRDGSTVAASQAVGSDGTTYFTSVSGNFTLTKL